MKLVEKFSYREIDVYRVEKKRALSTQEMSVVVDFENNKITGDCIAYGEWGTLELEECKEILMAIPEIERLRKFEDVLNSI